MRVALALSFIDDFDVYGWLRIVFIELISVDAVFLVIPTIVTVIVATLAKTMVKCTYIAVERYAFWRDTRRAYRIRHE